MLDYLEIKWIEVLREGTWNGRDYDREFMETLATSYDPQYIRAPLVIGHPGHSWNDIEDDGPALGHVLALRVEDTGTDKGIYRLMAEVGFLTEAVRLIESGKYNERSICWDNWYPMPGIPYLKHLGLLGEANPAVAGMEEITFTPMESVDEELAATNPAIYLSRPTALMWKQDDEAIYFKLRNPSRFRPNTEVRKPISENEGVEAYLAKLQRRYVPEGRDADDLFVRELIFPLERRWDLAKAKRWVKQNEGTLTANQAVQNKHNEINGGDTAVAADSEKQNEQGNQSGTPPQTFTSHHGSDKVMEKQVNPDAGGVTTTPETASHAPIPEEGAKPATPPVSPPPEQHVTTGESSKTVDDRITIQPQSEPDLERQNKILREKLDESNAELMRLHAQQNYFLSRDLEELHRKRVESAVANLLIEGYITPAQKDLGLVEALSAISDDVRCKVDGKDYKPIDIILACLRQGGKLKLKGEFETVEEQDAKAKYTELELASKGRNVKGIDVAARMNDLMSEGKSAEEALIIATKESGGKFNV